MFNLFKKKQPKQAPADIKLTIRDTMMGDMAPIDWPQGKSDAAPWSLFVEAREHISTTQNFKAAAEIYKKITEMPGLESRHYLQAWHFLRRLKVEIPSEVNAKVYGVLIDVHLENGLEFIAAYADHHARYFNYTGGGVIWEAPDSSLNDQIDTLLQACEVVSKQLPPLELEKGRPGAPKQVGAVQINILTPGGIRHGIGTFEGWAKNPTGGPIIATATSLMKTMVDKNAAAKSQ